MYVCVVGTSGAWTAVPQYVDLYRYRLPIWWQCVDLYAHLVAVCPFGGSVPIWWQCAHLVAVCPFGGSVPI